MKQPTRKRVRRSCADVRVFAANRTIHESTTREVTNTNMIVCSVIKSAQEAIIGVHGCLQRIITVSSAQYQSCAHRASPLLEIEESVAGSPLLMPYGLCFCYHAADERRKREIRIRRPLGSNNHINTKDDARLRTAFPYKARNEPIQNTRQTNNDLNTLIHTRLSHTYFHNTINMHPIPA